MKIQLLRFVVEQDKFDIYGCKIKQGGEKGTRCLFLDVCSEEVYFFSEVARRLKMHSVIFPYYIFFIPKLMNFACGQIFKIIYSHSR